MLCKKVNFIKNMAHHQSRGHGKKDTSTKTGAVGTAKRNIIRKGGTSPAQNRKARAASNSLDDYSEDVQDVYLDENDPNYDPEDFYPPIFHMCIKTDFEAATNGGELYYPPTYAQDKFVHASDDAKDLLGAGNHFYKESKGDWVCLKLDPLKLNCDVIYEKPAPVGDIAAYDHGDTTEFPHIYGGIPLGAVMEEYPIVRSDSGEFISITGLVE